MISTVRPIIQDDQEAALVHFMFHRNRNASFRIDEDTRPHQMYYLILILLVESRGVVSGHKR
jgi:hypothetical protein